MIDWAEIVTEAQRDPGVLERFRDIERIIVHSRPDDEIEWRVAEIDTTRHR